jgi:multidrug efflux system membrane fusion protein
MGDIIGVTTEIRNYLLQTQKPARLRIHFCAFTALLAVALTGCAEKKQPPRNMVVPVSVATASQKDVPVQLTAIGTVEPLNTVQIKSMVGGQITSVNFKEGQDVRKGALLFTIDRRPTEADLRRVEATLAKDMATEQNARADARRYQALFKEGVVARQITDQMQTAADAASALVQADRAAVENAKVQLQYTRIYSPIAGRTGDLQFQLGNLVRANDTSALVTVNQISPIYVTFSIPEQMLPQVKQYMTGRKLSVSASIAGDPRPAVGTLTFIDNTVDRQTGMIQLKGTFDNADRRLWPGQFVNVTLTLATQANAVVVPSQAVQNGQDGPFVFVVKNDKTAESRNVKVDRVLGDVAVITNGIKPGEVVVTDGQLRLTPGSKVDMKNGAPAAGAGKRQG